MKYIDKSSVAERGRNITRDYIESQCSVDVDGETRYQNISYSDFCSSGYKAQMIDALRGAQGNYCCYCMRDLSQNDCGTTLEHIIPQNPNPGDETRYRALGIDSLNSDVLVLDVEFTRMENQTMPPYPHNVAFDNFLNSCSGTFPDKEGTSQCCNNKRGNAFCIPLPLYSDVDNMVVYSENGNIRPSLEHPLCTEIAVSISAYHLMCENLVQVRRLWYLLRNVDYDHLVNCLYDGNSRNMLLTDVLFKVQDCIDLDSKIYRKYNRVNYWKTFLSYHWFQNKYREIYSTDEVETLGL